MANANVLVTYLPYTSNEVVVVVEPKVAEKVEEISWKKVFEKLYPEGFFYIGKAVREEVGFLVDPFKILFGTWESWAVTELPKEIEQKMERQGCKLMKLEIYIGHKPLLWGLLSYPAVKAVAIYHHPVPVAIFALLGIILAILVVVAIILHLLKEIDWTGPIAFIIPLVMGGVILFVLTREKKD